MSEVSHVRKVFEAFLRQVDELVDGIRSEHDRVKAQFERRLEFEEP
jgi:hypothetical protein